MNPTDRAELLAKLHAGHQELLAAVEGLSDSDAAARPAAGCWSAIEIIEHLAIVETNLLRNIQAAIPIEGEPPPSRDAAIFARVKTRGAVKVQAPPAAQPKGECACLPEALQKFQSARSRTLEFVQSHAGDLRLCTTTHPLIGPVTGWECLHMIAAHPFRHAAQIREFRALKTE